MQSSKLKVVTQADLKPFTKLRVLHLHGNHLTSLDNNLFDFNPNLVRVDFRHQTLKVIGYNIFDRLKMLALGDFQSAGCLDLFAQNGPKGIEDMKREIRVNCQPIDEMINDLKLLKDRVVALEASKDDKAKVVDFEGIPLMGKIDAKIAQMQEENLKCVTNLGAVTSNFLNLMQRVKMIEKSLKNKLSDSGSCTGNEIANELCQSEVEQLKREKREMSAVEIECERTEWLKESGRSCNVRTLTVFQPDIEIRKVTSGGQAIDAGSIEELKVFNQQATFMPLKLSDSFKNLNALSFVKCGLLTLDATTLSGLRKLLTLNLSHNKINEISGKELVELVALNFLDLSNNKLEKINDNAFLSLTELVTIKLNDNLLLELTSESFKSQTKLKFLFVQNNLLTFVRPTVLDSLKKLEFVDLSNNRCVDIAASKTSIVTIKSLEAFFKDNCAKF